MSPCSSSDNPFGTTRYFRFSDYLKRRFGCRVWKVAVDAGLGCPNRDGTAGYGGCSFCARDAHSPKGRTVRSVDEQIAEGIDELRRARSAERFIVYFQAGTNTYAPVSRLRALFDEALLPEDIVGLAVGTRADCLSDEILDLLAGYAADREVWLELGLQSSSDATLRAINRGHDLQCFLDAYTKARQSGAIMICLHLIIGLPGEDRGSIMATMRAVADLRPDGIKLHPLQVLRGTDLQAAYDAGELGALSLENYVSLCCDSLELLPPSIVIQRLTAEAPPGLLLAPRWCLDKRGALNAIGDELVRRDSWQGRRFTAME